MASNNNNLLKFSDDNVLFLSDSPRKKNHLRRHTLPSKFHHHPNFSHPYFTQHAHHLCNRLSDDSIDTSLLNQESLTLDDISGDSTDLEEKYFRIMAQELNSNKRKVENAENLSSAEIAIACPNEEILKEDINPDEYNPDPNEYNPDVYDPDVMLPENSILTPNDSEFDLDGMVKEMNELLSDANQELKKEEEDDNDEPPSPLSPRDPEREGPVLSEEEENTEEGVLYRFEHDPKFQDEAGLDEEEEGQISDDEGMDPMENH